MKNAFTLFVSLAVAASLFWPGLSVSRASVQQEKSKMSEYEGKVNAPEFPEGME